MHQSNRHIVAALAAAGLAAAPAVAEVFAQTTFDNGFEGWGALFMSDPSGMGDHIVDGGPGQGSVFRHVNNAWGVQFRNESNGAFLGDYARYGSNLNFSFDERNASLDFFQGWTGRAFHLQFTKVLDNGRSIIASYEFYRVMPDEGWVTHSVDIDVNATETPDGWRLFYNNLDPVTDYTFADIMADVDTVTLSNYHPDFAYPSGWFAVMFDNVTLSRAVPAPGALGLLGLAAVPALRRRR